MLARNVKYPMMKRRQKIWRHWEIRQVTSIYRISTSFLWGALRDSPKDDCTGDLHLALFLSWLRYCVVNCLYFYKCAFFHSNRTRLKNPHGRKSANPVKKVLPLQTSMRKKAQWPWIRSTTPKQIIQHFRVTDFHFPKCNFMEGVLSMATWTAGRLTFVIFNPCFIFYFKMWSEIFRKL